MCNKVIAVTNRHLCERPFPEQIRRVCSLAHPDAVILREKDLPAEAYLALAEEIGDICSEYGVLLIPHFYREAAEALGSRWLHLPLGELRKLRREEESRLLAGGKQSSEGETQQEGARQEMKIGCSVHSEEEALEAERLGAAYLTAGHIFETDCKKGLPGRGLTYLEQICRTADLPVYAIGGIRPDPEQIRMICSRGAAGVCIMSAMMRL